MTSLAQTQRPASDRFLMGWIGFGYLIIIAAGVFAEFMVRAPLRAPEVLVSSSAIWPSIAADLVMIGADIGVGVLFYQLLKPFGPRIAFVALLCRLAQATALMANTGILALANQAGADSVSLQAALAAHFEGYQLALIFFGLSLVFLTPLLIRSHRFPMLLASLTFVAGLSYVFDGVAALASYTALAGPVGATTTTLAIIAEFSLCGWLLSAPLRRL